MINYIYFGWMRDNEGYDIQKNGQWDDMGGEVVNHVIYILYIYN